MIVKKNKNRHHAPFHGGSWKIAYADFMTTLMTFFLVMWLISMGLSQAKKQEVTEYYKTYQIFSPTELLRQEKKVKGYRLIQTMPLNAQKANIATPEELKKKLKDVIEEKLNEYKDYIIVKEEADGVRTDIVDPEGDLLFTVGSPHLQARGEKILAAMSQALVGIDNKIVLEGHTDARPYPSSEYTNWELSTERASSARKELEKNGVTADRIMMVAGYAETKPIIMEDPLDPRNRRISIFILNPSFIAVHK